ncbi:MAG: hypothetical protein IPK22_11310 [Verrucomicrobiaceae bacterium]|nr:hypothetical protein [Verrucomicrobiaceae bacterium]
MNAQPLAIRATTGKLISPAAIEAILGTLLQLQITFKDAVDATVVHPEGTTGRLVLKAPQSLGGATVLVDSAWTYDAETEAYTLATWVYSSQLVALIDAADGDDADFTLRANVEWQLPAEDKPRKSYPFDVLVINTPSRPDDTAPDVAGELASGWLDTRSPRIDKSLALTAPQRTQLLTNIGNTMQLRLSDDAAHLHTYTPAGIYKGSIRLIDLGQSNL